MKVRVSYEHTLAIMSLKMPYHRINFCSNGNPDCAPKASMRSLRCLSIWSLSASVCQILLSRQLIIFFFFHGTDVGTTSCTMRTACNNKLSKQDSIVLTPLCKFALWGIKKQGVPTRYMTREVIIRPRWGYSVP